MSQFDDRLRALTPAVLTNLRRGIEKEGLRVRPDGKLASTPHPAALGSALTHPHITTDFSESQLELVTGAHKTVESCLEELDQLHQFVYRHIGDEIMWGASMPCQLPSEQDIPIGRYGTSNVGIAKTVYRTGLSYRYGRRMQTISGLHYNFSLPTDAWPLPGLAGPNEGYFSLIRNFRRHVWLVQYLYGASPAVCSTFVQGRSHNLQELPGGTLYLPHATSLRMGRLGYLSEAQDSLKVSHNCIETYTASLFEALTKPYPPYESIGIKVGNEYHQLATSLLQIENEFYSTIRPKRVTDTAERPLHALRERGVEYIEVRAMDLDPFSPIGIAADTARFLDIFLLWCLLRDSPSDTAGEIEAIGHNKQATAARGRQPGLELKRDGQMLTLRDWGAQVLRDCAPIAEALDAAHAGDAYAKALAAASEAFAHPESLPSARMLAGMASDHDNSFGSFALALSQQHRQTLTAAPLADALVTKFAQMAETSLAEQRSIEAADTMSFEAYRQRYLAPESLIPGKRD